MMNYSLAVRNVKSLNRYYQLYRVIESMDLIKYTFDKGSYYKDSKEAFFNSWEEQQWPNWFGRMISLSEMFNEMTFELTIQENDCFKRIYFKDGTSETCYGEVIYQAPKKLKWDTLIVF